MHATGLSIYEQTVSAGANDGVIGGKMVGTGDALLARSLR